MAADRIIWQDPPGITNRSGGPPRVWEPLLTPLMEHPGRWALVKSYTAASSARNSVTGLRLGRVRAPAGRWEFTSRTNGDSADVYARYLGPEEE